MVDKVTQVSVQSIEVLEKLHEVFDELGLARQYSLDNGELEIKFEETWVLFYVDKRLMEDQALLDQAFEDAQMIAEGHWRE
jgi:peptidyl-tRNA hydrolase